MQRIRIDKQMDAVVVQWLNNHHKQPEEEALEYTYDVWRLLLTSNVPSALLFPLRGMFTYHYPELEEELTWV